MRPAAFFLGALLFFSGCALVKTTRCAEVTSWGLSAMEPATGTLMHLGYLHYKRIAAPENYAGTVDCFEFSEAAKPPNAKLKK